MSNGSNSEPGEKYSAPAAACAAEILKYLARAPEPQSPPEIARAIGRSKSLVFRVLQELMRQEFVERPANGNAYALAFGALEVGTAFLAKSDFMHSIQTVLRDLARTTEETVNLGVLRGNDVLYLAKHEGRNSVLTLSHVGGRVPATCTSLGKAILAQLPQTEVKALVPKPLPRLTSQSIGTLTALAADLAATRQRGWAFDDGEAVLGRSCIERPSRSAVRGLARLRSRSRWARIPTPSAGTSSGCCSSMPRTG